MKKMVNGKVYNTETAQFVGTDIFNEREIFKKNTGEYFYKTCTTVLFDEDGEYVNYDLFPMSLFEAIHWGLTDLSSSRFELVFGATKEDFMSLANGTVEHTRYISKEGNEYVQDDVLTTRISLHALENEAKNCLNYWWVEEFDRAYIDWENHEIVLVHRAEHYVPKGYAFEMLKQLDTIDLTREEREY